MSSCGYGGYGVARASYQGLKAGQAVLLHARAVPPELREGQLPVQGHLCERVWRRMSVSVPRFLLHFTFPKFILALHLARHCAGVSSVVRTEGALNREVQLVPIN